MGSLLEGGKPRTYDKLLYMKDDDRVRVRLLDTTPAKRIFLHSAKDTDNRFIEVLCVGIQSGCPFCRANQHPKVAGLQNAQKPYPGRVRFVKPVYVHDKGQVMLLGGKEVWQQIDNANSLVGSVIDRDIIILRKKAERVAYIAQADAPSPFTKQLNPADFPKVEDYIAWLRANIDEAVLVDMESWTAQAAPVSPFTSQNMSSSTLPVPPPPPPTPPPVVSGVKGKEALIDDVMDMIMGTKASQADIADCMKKAAPSKGKFGEYSQEELLAMVGLLKGLQKK